MPIQRYTNTNGSMVCYDQGTWVIYQDHEDDKEKSLCRLLGVLADIRNALGVGHKTMMTELAQVVKDMLVQHDCELQRVQIQRDAFRGCLEGLEVDNVDTLGTYSHLLAHSVGAGMAKAIRDIAQQRDEARADLHKVLDQLGSMLMLIGYASNLPQSAANGVVANGVDEGVVGATKMLNEATKIHANMEAKYNGR